MTVKIGHCEDCVFWKQYTGKPTGECRRYPPRQSDEMYRGWWPTTVSLEWCGEYKESP